MTKILSLTNELSYPGRRSVLYILKIVSIQEQLTKFLITGGCDQLLDFNQCITQEVGLKTSFY